VTKLVIISRCSKLGALAGVVPGLVAVWAAGLAGGGAWAGVVWAATFG
jgi:hypothetical protein